MTQKEFDCEMVRINAMQAKEKEGLYAEIDRLDEEKRVVFERIMAKKREMETLYLQLSTLKDARAIYIRKVKDINTRYHEMKHQLIIDNPKGTTKDE